MVSVDTNRIHLPVTLRFKGVVARWSIREDRLSGERVFVPVVDKPNRLAPVRDAHGIRAAFLRSEFSESNALDFLNEVGVWSHTESLEGMQGTGDVHDGMRLTGSFGQRYIVGRALPISLKGICDEQQYWRKLLRSRSSLQHAYRPAIEISAPGAKPLHALETNFSNTLPVYLEAARTNVTAVVEPVTGWEMLIALAWLDLATGAAIKTCQNPSCGAPYTHSGRKYCTETCASSTRTRRHRHSLKQREAERYA